MNFLRRLQIESEDQRYATKIGHKSAARAVSVDGIHVVGVAGDGKNGEAESGGEEISSALGNDRVKASIEKEKKRRRAAAASRSKADKRKEYLIIVKQFILYALFLVSMTDMYLYQALLEAPSYCSPVQNSSALPGDPYACYEPCRQTLDATTSFADSFGAFNARNEFGYPEYVLQRGSGSFYYMRGNFPYQNRVLHFIVPAASAALCIFYAGWRFARHHHLVSLSNHLKVVGAVVGFVLFATLAAAAVGCVFVMDPAVRLQWLNDTAELESVLQSLRASEAAENAAWKACTQNPTLLNSSGTVLAYTTANMTADMNAALLFRASIDVSSEGDVEDMCKHVCAFDESCVAFYLRKYSLELSSCSDAYFCDVYHSVDFAGGSGADCDSESPSEASESRATSDLGPSDSVQAANGFCALFDDDLVADVDFTNHGLNVTNVTFVELIDRSAYVNASNARARLWSLAQAEGSLSTTARVWHESFISRCKDAAFDHGYLGVYGFDATAHFVTFDVEATSGAEAIVPGLNITSPECLALVDEYKHTMSAATSSSFLPFEVSSGNVKNTSSFAMGGSVVQLIGILEVVFLIPIAAISAITVGTRIMTLITRHERCQNCEMVYTLKDQPLTCASCQDVFCKQCLVYSVKGQKFGLFSSEVRSGDSKSLKQKLVCMDCFNQSFDKSVGVLLHYSLGQNDLATGYLNFLLNLFVMELEEKVRSRGFDDERVHDEALHSFSNAGNQVVVFIRLKTKDEIVRNVRAELRRTFGDMLEFREDFVKETLSVLDTLYNFADALTTRGNSATLAEFHKQTRKFPRSSFSDVFLDKYNMDIEKALSSATNARKVKHLGTFQALFAEVLEFTRNREEPDPDAKPVLVSHAYMFEELIRVKFRNEADPFYKSESAVQTPNETVLEFAKKYAELPPQMQDLFHEQLLWHSKAAQQSFSAQKATTTAQHQVFVVMVRPYSNTQAPKIYHMYVLEDFLAFFNAPQGFSDPCLTIDASIFAQQPPSATLKEHIHAKAQILFEEFIEDQTVAAQENKGAENMSESKEGASAPKLPTRRVSLHDLAFILTRSDIPNISKQSRVKADFGGPAKNAEGPSEVAAHKALQQYYARGKTQIVLKGIFSHVLEVVHARAPNAQFKDRLEKLSSLQTNRLFSKLLEWQSSLPTSNSLGILRFESSYPPRDTGRCKMYLNGLDYFRDVVEAIGAARHNVMIADWCMSPRIFLRRESGPIETFRLDLLLQRKARQGVHVYVLLYRDIAIGLGSGNTEDYLDKLHANINVVRHNCMKSTDEDKFSKIYYSHHQKCVVVDNSAAFVGGIDLCYGRFETPEYTLSDLHGKWYPGHSYKNPQLELPGADGKSHIHEPYLTAPQIDRHFHWRMPWNDVHSCVTGKAAADVALMLSQRWQVHTQTNGEDKATVPVWPAQLLRDWHLDGTWKAGSVQLLRSMACWSGNEMVETSIYRCYLEMIRTAKHSIYIENQFFISAIEGNNTVHNRICQALFDRIMIAIHQKQQFRVVIVVPFHADGPLHSEMAMSVLHYLRASVAFTPTSLLHCLTRECGKIKDRSINLEDYIVFLSLAQWGEMTYEARGSGLITGDLKSVKYGRRPVYSQVYTHSKLMIVDDWCLIVGSANINDRSMIGDRDSEMAVYVEDKELVNVQMGSKEVAVGKNIHRFRMELMNKLLGEPPGTETTSNFLCDEVYKDILLRTAKVNTEAFHAVFPEFPHSSYRSLAEFDEAVKEHEESLKSMDVKVRFESDKKNIESLTQSVKGLVCRFPLKFLELDPTLISSERLKAQIADVVSGGRFFT